MGNSVIIRKGFFTNNLIILFIVLFGFKICRCESFKNVNKETQRYLGRSFCSVVKEARQPIGYFYRGLGFDSW